MNKKIKKMDKQALVIDEKKEVTFDNKTGELHVNEKKQKITEVKIVKESPVQVGLGRLEIAYEKAIGGKIKFKKVRTIFEEIHEEIKSSAKK